MDLNETEYKYSENHTANQKCQEYDFQNVLIRNESYKLKFYIVLTFWPDEATIGCNQQHDIRQRQHNTNVTEEDEALHDNNVVVMKSPL